MACLMNIANPVGNYGETRFPLGSRYGWRIHPITGENTFHFGVDIPAPSGTNVRSADAGIVTASRWSDSAGNLIKVLHPNGFVSVYMHLLVRHVNKGDTVRAGDIIGAVGQTGQVTGNHLHFELIDAEGNRFDPAECYYLAVDIIPYQYVPEGQQPDPEVAPKKPIWPWIVGGGLVIGTTILIIGATRDKNS